MIKNLSDKFAEKMSEFGIRTAFNYDEITYSYQQFDRKSDRYCSGLIQENIQRGDVIGIFNGKEFESYCLMLACLKLGVTYVNLDSSNPKIRITQIINKCNLKGIFYPSSEKSLPNFPNIKILNDHILSRHLKKPVFSDFDGNTIAYIMFTSGSTGEPKGVSITHQNLMYFIQWVKERYQITSKDNFANISPMYFDNSVFDFYGALFNGACITPIKKELLDKPVELINFISEQKCTIWFSVPSMLIFLINMKVLKKGVCDSIRVFTFGGEGFPKSILKKLYDQFSKQAKLINVYGPTEGTCICSSYDISDKDFEDLSELPSLGQINPNFSYQIIDDKGNSTKAGELIIIGPCISPNYYNDHEKSEKVFGKVSSGPYYLNNFYRTGDLVEERDGLLYFKGRADNQIKHMGYRIELEEIENALNKYIETKESAVIYKRVNDSYGKIIAFVSMEKSVDEAVLKTYLKETLPSYMIPSKILEIDVLPKNANGKIDRKSLKL